MNELLTIYLKNVGLKQLLVSISMTAVVAHVGGSHFGNIQGAVISEILANRKREVHLVRETSQRPEVAVMAEGILSGNEQWKCNKLSVYGRESVMGKGSFHFQQQRHVLEQE